MNWLIDNKEWFFSGAGIAIVSLVVFLYKYFTNDSSSEKSNFTDKQNDLLREEKEVPKVQKMSLDDHKNCTKILFIDDDVKFKVVKILTRSGWVHTKLIKDCETLDDISVVDAHILFIDVQGVGVSMGFSDEGLGLALAIKEKYKDKKVVIYSAETEGDRFHEALRKADSFLAKNADPYQFQRLVEEFTVGMEDGC